MKFELEGILIEKNEEQEISEKFKKLEFVIEVTENNFTEKIKFQLVNDKVDLLDKSNVGDTIKVHFNIKGNKWKDNYFVNLQAWRIEPVSSGKVEQENNEPEEADDLPF